ncbi:MAG: DUF177 domain-containing protein [Bryobacteraceae bacterium]
MFLSIREMELRKLSFDEAFPPGEIEYLDRKLRQASDLKVSGSAELLPNTDGEIRIKGHLEVRMEADCDRCLESATFPVDVSFDLYYEPADSVPHSEELEVGAGESELDFYEGEGLELELVLREQVLLALPMQRVCRADCKGICPVCGQNRNNVECNCRTETADDRWAALRDLSEDRERSVVPPKS